jgi:23S rRNA maturation mini-RNase III
LFFGSSSRFALRQTFNGQSGSSEPACTVSKGTGFNLQALTTHGLHPLFNFLTNRRQEMGRRSRNSTTQEHQLLA